jgi:hypothetical protein
MFYPNLSIKNNAHYYCSHNLIYSNINIKNVQIDDT